MNFELTYCFVLVPTKIQVLRYLETYKKHAASKGQVQRNPHSKKQPYEVYYLTYLRYMQSLVMLPL